ncbi:MAG TPA: 23S rRNA (pseudouridine(1915)-N(3))-methyltransferase RlmH [Candidatus Saccharimonadales bacterium]|nr:23S rRNA (pseudouridine(1915)-N(3))-methyltransferase RlmH [Candidatus Saccharimonadales bacterium]
MKLHIITIGRPKLAYAKLGWEEYWQRLQHYHDVRVSHIADAHNDTAHILDAAGKSYIVALVINGTQLSSPEVADFLQARAVDGREVSFIIGGPNGLPQEVIDKAHFQWSFSTMTLPHDLAMVTLLEALYRASTINSGHPYHKQ